MPRTTATPYASSATVKIYPAEGIARPITLRIATIVSVLAAGDTAKAMAIRRTVEVTVALRQQEYLHARINVPHLW